MKELIYIIVLLAIAFVFYQGVKIITIGLEKFIDNFKQK